MSKIVSQLAAALLACGLLIAQPPQPQGPERANQDLADKGPGGQISTSQEPQELPESKAEALRSLAAQLKIKRDRRSSAIAENIPATVSQLDGEIQQLRWQFASLMTQVDVQQFEAPEAAQLDLMTEALEALRPIVGALNDITEPARRKQDLKRAIEVAEDREEVIREARDKVRQVLASLRSLPPSAANTVAIEQATIELQEHWLPSLAHVERQLIVLRENQRQLEQDQDNWLTSLRAQSSAILDSGISIVTCIAVFLTVFYLLRFLSGLIVGKRASSQFPRRLLKVLLRILTLSLAIAATLVVPFAREDYVLMTLGIVFVVGVGWVVAKSAPLYVEQIRLILNIGSVREGERIVVDGLPYKVDALRFYSRLSNPALTGGALRVPIEQLIGERSRAAGPDEPWFPCHEGDIVAIDNIVGRVQLQTPEMVVVAERQDAPRNYPTATFLSLNPRNLSRGFEVYVTFGIDYAHQTEAIDKIPALLQNDLAAGLAQCTDAQAVGNVRVELAEAGSNSLNLEVEVQFAGPAAGHYHSLKRRINRLLVQSCSQHGFGIPLPQLQVQQRELLR
jgi:hypothetical protein